VCVFGDGNSGRDVRLKHLFCKYLCTEFIDGYSFEGEYCNREISCFCHACIRLVGFPESGGYPPDTYGPVANRDYAGFIARPEDTGPYQQYSG